VRDSDKLVGYRESKYKPETLDPLSVSLDNSKINLPVDVVTMPTTNVNVLGEQSVNVLTVPENQTVVVSGSTVSLDVNVLSTPATQPVQITGSSVTQNVSVQGIPDVNIATVSVPIDTQLTKRKQTTEQVLLSVAVAASGNATTGWLDTDGFDESAFTVLSQSLNHKVSVYWSNDGGGTHGAEYDILPQSNQQHRAVIVQNKARYIKLRIDNTHTATQTFTAWLYRKS
jgi:hypothetical protein